MTDRPILFQPILCDGIDSGRKTMTRRFDFKCEVGDRLWVRESHWRWGQWINSTKPVKRITKKGKRIWEERPCIAFEPQAATLGNIYFGRTPPGRVGNMQVGDEVGWHKRPSIFLPRELSRFTLVVTEKRREPLWSITAEDAIREGIVEDDGDTPNIFYLPGHGAYKLDVIHASAPQDVFASLWRCINGPNSWEMNPEVDVIGFRVIKANIGSDAARLAA